MVTNALSPMRVIEALGDSSTRTAPSAVMSSGQGSVANNENGGFEIYRASKSALNQLMRSYAARHHGEGRTLLLMAPGWVKTALGGPVHASRSTRASPALSRSSKKSAAAEVSSTSTPGAAPLPGDGSPHASGMHARRSGAGRRISDQRQCRREKGSAGFG